MSNQPVRQKNSETPWGQALTRASDKFLTIVGKEQETIIELGFASQIIEGSDKLKACDPISITNAIINVARTGITLNPELQYAYLIPRKGKCKLEFSYRGLVHLLKDYGCIKDIQTFIVYQDEEFWEGGSQIQPPKHTRIYPETEEEQKRRKVKGAYCQVLLPDGTIIWTPFKPYWEILRAKKNSVFASDPDSPWNNYPEDMIKKTTVKSASKLLLTGKPNQKVLNAIALDNENEGINFNTTPQKLGFKSRAAIFGEEVQSEMITGGSTTDDFLNSDANGNVKKTEPELRKPDLVSKDVHLKPGEKWDDRMATPQQAIITPIGDKSIKIEEKIPEQKIKPSEGKITILTESVTTADPNDKSEEIKKQREGREKLEKLKAAQDKNREPRIDF